MPLNTLNHYQAYFFDLDGTLIDSSGDLADAINRVRIQYGLSILSNETVEVGVGYGASALIQHCFPQELNLEFKALREAFTQAYGKQLFLHTQAYPEAERVLNTLKANPNTKLALITNKPSRFAIPLLEALGWSDLFDLYLYGDSLAERKPSNLPIKHALTHFNLNPNEALFIGDSEVDALAATAAHVDLAIISWGRAASSVKAGQYGSEARVIELSELLS